LLVFAAGGLAAPAIANVPAFPADPASAYVAARAASISGDHAGAAQLYARLATQSNDSSLKQRAVSEAIRAGQMDLALALVRQSPAVAQSVTSKLLLVADALKRGSNAEAARLMSADGKGVDLSFWKPMIEAWSAADRGDSAGALAILARVPRKSALSPFVDEESAFILLKLRKTEQAEPYARRAIGSAGQREYRIRLALAQAFQAAGDQPRALAMLDGISGDTSAIRQQLASGRLASLAIDSASSAFADQLIALGLEMRGAPRPAADPIDIVQIARYLAPGNGSASILLGNLLSDAGDVGDALAAYHSVPDDSALKSEALDSEVRSLIDSKRLDEALAVAQKPVGARDATSDDYARLGDVYSAMERYDDAAATYARAIALAPKGQASDVWPLLLVRASALESGDRWPEAKQALAEAMALAPNEPLILNFLGYAKLEHGEDLDLAEALIRKASELAPDDASITDSLGWALYKRGRLDEAITVLQKAAIGDPAQAEIQEHLGDALYTAGRRFEARFAWAAALATADQQDMSRIRGKIESGLASTTESH
jgi:tetratricopeptide (TPR) repeat protein